MENQINIIDYLAVMQTGSTIAIDACELVLAKPRPEHNILSLCFGHELVSIRLVPCVTRESGIKQSRINTWFAILIHHNINLD